MTSRGSRAASRSWRSPWTPACWAGWSCGSATGSTPPACAPASSASGTSSSRGAVMAFNVGEIVSVISREIQEARTGVEAIETGRVLEVGDGIARVYGLSHVMAGEMVEFPDAKVRGMAFNLEESSVGVIILGDYKQIEEGHEVRS